VERVSNMIGGTFFRGDVNEGDDAGFGARRAAA
jgi:hypothetical protein